MRKNLLVLSEAEGYRRGGMLDINFIRENEKAVRKAITDKGVALDLDELLTIDVQRRALQQEVDDMRHQMNEIAGAVPKAEADARGVLIEKGKELKAVAAEKEAGLQETEEQWRELMLQVPNVPSDDSPVGDESANLEIARWGEPTTFSFTPKSHIELGESLDLLGLERGTKVAGFRGYYLKNELALLHWAVLWHTFRRMQERGFTVMVPPIIVRELALVGSGHFPGEREEVYEVDASGEKVRETKYLAGTSEPSLLAYRAGEILEAAELPLKYSGLSACYRREVGGYGKDAKGLYRVHEFSKVEQVIICEDDLEKSLELFEELRKNATDLLEELELPYRVLQISTGDMGAGKYKMYDIETWMPSRGGYGETHSNSHLTDWQTRRLGIRYRTKDGELRVPYAMNNTAIASPRILIAILENYQQEDGSVLVPVVLRPYVGFDSISPKR